jgi:hypothetical protein
MYATCLHCHHGLGTNETIEHFAVGRRLAFDPSRGRLWVVCGRCQRWNLTPVEERWEAIEECERLYRGTRLRASTDNIGMARVGDGMEIIRIGSPPGPEIAAWRYVGELRRRWFTRGLPVATGSAIVGAMPVVNGALSPVLGGAVVFGLIAAIGGTMALIQRRYERARIVTSDGRVRTIIGKAVRQARVVPVADGWAVATGQGLAFDPGHASVHSMRAIMTARNYGGGSRREVDAALSHLGEVGDPARFITRLARATQRTGIEQMPRDMALALEMALHDEVERRALEGELRALETEWIVAEEIAGIADDRLLPAAVQDRLRDLSVSL